MEKLDPQQMSAVNTPWPMTMVVAGAGAGKTRVLIERIAHLVENCKVQPNEIIAMTFTRKAAAQMKERLEARLGPRAHGVIVGTIHSLALKYIRLFGENLGLRYQNISIYGPWEEAFLLKDTAKLTKTKGKITIMEEYYSSGVEPDNFHPQRRLFDVFMFRLRQYNAVTYGMLLIGMRALASDIVRTQIRHILLDEIQDMDSVQWGIVNELKLHNDKIEVFAVGDIDQSIYEWRGAVPERMLEMQLGSNTLEAAHKDWSVYLLETNYRSGVKIVEAADRLIQHNSRRIHKTMVAAREDKGRLVMGLGIDSAGAAKMIQHMTKLGASCAVLARTHVLLVKLSMELNTLGVQHHYCGRGSKFMQSEAFRRPHAILNLMHNPLDNFSFAMCREILGVSDEQYTQLMVDAVDANKSHLDAWIASGQNDWSELFKDCPGMKFIDMIERIFMVARTYGWVFSIEYAMAQDFAGRGGTLEEYLEWIATYDVQVDTKSVALLSERCFARVYQKTAERPWVRPQGQVSYAADQQRVRELVALVGEEPLRRAYFTGDVEALRTALQQARTRDPRRFPSWVDLSR